MKKLIKFDPTNPAPPVTTINFFIRIRQSGNVLLFHVLRQSTIGAERLDFRVRNGIGYYTFAIITRHRIYILKLLIVNIKKLVNIVFIYLNYERKNITNYTC